MWTIGWLILLLVRARAKEYSPVNSNYIKYQLKDPSICSPISDKVVELSDLKTYPHAGVLLTPGRLFDAWNYAANNKHCKFKIKTSEKYGIFAVVQKMSLRGSESQCLDYVTFLHGDKNATKKRYCGNIDLQQTNKQLGMSLLEIFINPGKANNKLKLNGTGMYEDFDKSGEITTEIFISKQPLLPNETLDLVIAYTPYDKDCAPFDNNVESLLLTGNPCVDTKFYCDNVFNCFSKNCSDEIACGRVHSEVGTGAKVTVSAVTSIIMCFVIFFLCLWICRRNEKLCWSPDCAGPGAITGNVSGLPAGQANNQASAPRGGNASAFMHTAPILEVAVSSSVHDKDLPPSYDSLFPPQQQTPATGTTQGPGTTTTTAITMTTNS